MSEVVKHRPYLASLILSTAVSEAAHSSASVASHRGTLLRSPVQCARFGLPVMTKLVLRGSLGSVSM